MRELANVIERAVVLGQGPKITPQDLPPTFLAPGPIAMANSISYHEAVEAHRKQLIVQALDQANGNRVAAAKALGLHRTHLMKLMKSLGIE